MVLRRHVVLKRKQLVLVKRTVIRHVALRAADGSKKTCCAEEKAACSGKSNGEKSACCSKSTTDKSSKSKSKVKERHSTYCRYL